jgi:hypothetical protein
LECACAVKKWVVAFNLLLQTISYIFKPSFVMREILIKVQTIPSSSHPPLFIRHWLTPRINSTPAAAAQQQLNTTRRQRLIDAAGMTTKMTMTRRSHTPAPEPAKPTTLKLTGSGGRGQPQASQQKLKEPEREDNTNQKPGTSKGTAAGANNNKAQGWVELYASAFRQSIPSQFSKIDKACIHCGQKLYPICGHPVPPAIDAAPAPAAKEAANRTVESDTFSQSYQFDDRFPTFTGQPFSIVFWYSCGQTCSDQGNGRITALVFWSPHLMPHSFPVFAWRWFRRRWGLGQREEEGCSCYSGQEQQGRQRQGTPASSVQTPPLKSQANRTGPKTMMIADHRLSIDPHLMLLYSICTVHIALHCISSFPIA